MVLFTAELKKVFDHSTPGRKAARELLNLVQGDSRIADYSIKFRKVAADSKWNAPSLYNAIYNGLSNVIKDEVAAEGPPMDLDSLITTVNRNKGLGHLASSSYDWALTFFLVLLPSTASYSPCLPPRQR